MAPAGNPKAQRALPPILERATCTQCKPSKSATALSLSAKLSQHEQTCRAQAAPTTGLYVDLKVLERLLTLLRLHILQPPKANLSASSQHCTAGCSWTPMCVVLPLKAEPHPTHRGSTRHQQHTYLVMADLTSTQGAVGTPQA
jgi:hypothetical protein